MKLAKKIAQSKYFHHLIFWIISFIILHQIFTIDYNNGLTDVIYTLLFHLPLVFLVYLNYALIDKYFTKRHYGQYLLLILFAVICSVILNIWIFSKVSNFIFPGYYFISYYSLQDLLLFSLSYVVISFFLKLTIKWFDLKEKQLTLEKENNAVKLKNLQNQINPHFLFNNLNNIYSISKGNEQTRTYISKLANSLRYMIYETNEDFGLLEKEIQHITNYIDLEKLRLADPEHVSLDLKGNYEGYMIAPLILLPLVENCFKYCNEKNPLIKINIHIEDDILKMETWNNLSDTLENKQGGFGLNNVKKRLELIYKGKYKLGLKQKTEVFLSILEINLA